MTANSHPSQKQDINFSMDDFAQALEQEQYSYHFNKGNTVKGKVVQHDSNGSYVDIGGKSPGFVPLKESSWEAFTDVNEVLPLNEEFEFLIIREQDADGQVTLSRRQLHVEQVWNRLTEIAESGKVVEMLATGTNRGGLIGEVEGLRAFIPRSHLIEKENLETLVNQYLPANILQIERNENKLVLSQREIARSAALSQIQEGEVVKGKVVKIQPYGVFIDCEGITGLLHIKQISNGHIASLTSLFKVGEEVKVVVLEVDELKQRISLSTKILESYPGEFLEKREEVMENAEQRLAKVKEAREKPQNTRQ